MAILGRQQVAPSGGAGAMLSGRIRASIMGTVQSAGWARRFGFWAGRNTASASSAAMALYQSTGTVIGNLVAQTAVVPVTAAMNEDTGAGGAAHYQTVTGVPVSPGQNYALALRVTSTSLAYGQDLSGHPMHFKTAATFASPYAALSVSAQGKMSLWLEYEANRKPSLPQILNPTNNGTVTDTTPTITVKHTDPDTAYGDRLRWYKIEIWDGNNASRLQTSGQVEVSAVDAAASGNVATFTAAVLTAGASYTIRASTYDYHGVISDTATSRFTVNSGGVFTNLQVVELESTLDVDGNGILDSTEEPTLRATWTHADTTATATISVSIRRMDTSAIYRDARTVTRTVANNGTTDILYADGSPDWAVLARSGIPLRFEITATDALSGIAATTVSNTFVMNPRPAVPINLYPADGQSVSTAPPIRFKITDENNGPQDLHFVVIVDDDTNTSYNFLTTESARFIGNDTWEIQLTGSHLRTGNGTYEWTVAAYDPYGSVFDATVGPTTTFSMVDPPAILITNPDDDEVITTGTPLITWTVDRTQSRRWIRIWRPDYSFDTGWATTASTSYQVPALSLKNDYWYDVRIDVETSDGLTAWSHTQFEVQYPQPSAMTGVTLTPVMSSVFDNGGSTYPPQYPNLKLAWIRVDEATVSNEDWQGYRVTREIAGQPLKDWVFMDRNQVDFTDTSPENAVLCTYTVSYRKDINNGFDIIDSTPVVLSDAAVILYPTLTSDSPDDPAVTMHFWQDIKSQPQTDHEEVPSWGVLPFLFQGPKNQEVINGTFRVIDDDTGANLFTSRDIVQAAKALQQPGRDANGKPVPKTLNYRDQRTSVPGVSVRDFSEDYDRNTRTATFTLRLSQHA